MNKPRLYIIYLSALALMWAFGAFASMDVEFDNAASSYLFINSTSGNVGIGTAVPASRLSIAGGVGIGTNLNSAYVRSAAPSGGMIVQGNMGIGTLTTAGGNLIINGGGNMGVGTAWPGAALDIQGNLRASGVITGNFLTGWTNVGSILYLDPSTNNVGIGTSTPQGGLVVTNGNVGIGTWTAGGGNLIVLGGGNTGIASAWPGAVLDVSGTARMTAFSLPTSPTNNYALTSNTVGVGTWAPFASGPLSSLTIGYLVKASSSSAINSSSVFQLNGNIGIGTTTPVNTLTFADGNNLGIGTWRAANRIAVVGSAAIGSAAYASTTAPANGLIVSGNTGIGTFAAANQLSVVGAVGIGTSTYVSFNAASNGLNVAGNVGLGSLTPGAALDIAGKTRITASGHFVTTGTLPTISACGPGPSGIVNSTDNNGLLTTGNSTPASCTITFANAWTNAPVCVAQNNTTASKPIQITTTTTTLVMTNGAFTNGSNLSWICIGNE